MIPYVKIARPNEAQVQNAP